MMVRFCLLLITLYCLNSVYGQRVSGSWYGKADVLLPGNTSNYLTEFILKQKGSDQVEGIFGYYFKDSYQSFFVRGTFNPKSRQITIRNIPLLFHASPARTGIECPMNFQGTLLVSKLGSSIKGSFYTEPKYKYTCPELRVTLNLDANEHNQDSILNNPTAKRWWKPQEGDLFVNNYSLVSDSTPLPGSSGAVDMPVSFVSKPLKQLEEEFGKRNHIYEKDIVVSSDTILVSFYDNGDIDDDTISVFLNKIPVLLKRGLSSRALNIYIGLDTALEVNELSMFADNLGKYPPNTALMVISDGPVRHEFYLSASLKQNASVRLRRQKP